MVDALVTKTREELSRAGVTLGAVTTHAPVMTAEEHQKVAGHLQGTLVKNLLMKSKKKNLYLAVVKGDAKVNMKTLGKSLKDPDLRMAADDLAVLGVKQGSVTPLAVMNDAKKAVTVLLDVTLTDHILVHPLTNEATVAISVADLRKFLTAQGTPFKDIDFNAADVPAAAPAPAKQAAKGPKPAKGDKVDKQASKPAEAAGADAKSGKVTGLALSFSKSKNFSAWYQQIVKKSELIDYYPVSGCYILRPWSYSIWEHIQSFFDGQIKKLGVQNSYFPLFISEKALMAEKDHIEGFAPEVAWVTRSGTSELDEPIAIRPTSETVMYPAFKKWIRSHRDLPLRLNQWCNVVRWEFKCPTPFLRTREFLWQEGHSAFSSREEAEVEVLQILELYRQVYEELLAVPVVKGKKSETERFAGGFYTTTVEAFIPGSGRGIQGATSHCLGQNFAEMFHIDFLDDEGKSKKVWQNSWGLTTRTIGVMVMVHGDDQGLVLPPRVAPTQVIIVPIVFKDQREALNAKCHSLVDELKAIGVRAEYDGRDLYTPAWKFNYWERKGVPLRLELGPKDVAAEQVLVVRRDTGERTPLKWSEMNLLPTLLEKIQHDMFTKAKNERDSRLAQCTTWDSFLSSLNQRMMAMAPWCGIGACEESMKDRTAQAAEPEEQEAADGADGGAADDDEVVIEKGEKLTGAAKSLCVPFRQPPLAADATCVGCGSKAICWTLFGRSY